MNEAVEPPFLLNSERNVNPEQAIQHPSDQAQRVIRSSRRPDRLNHTILEIVLVQPQVTQPARRDQGG